VGDSSLPLIYRLDKYKYISYGKISKANGDFKMRIGSGSFRYFIMIAILGFIMAAPSAVAQNISASDLTYITEQFPPINYVEDGELMGISVDLLEKIFDRMGADTDRSSIQVLLWDEGYRKALDEENTVIFATARIPERESLFKWVGPIAPSDKAIFARKDSKITIETGEDLLDLRIGVVRNDSAVQLVQDAGLDLEDLVQENDPSTLIEMLENDTIDAWAYGTLAAPWLFRDSGADPEDFEAVYILGEVEDYYAFNINTSDSLVQEFQDALDNVKQELNEDGTNDYQKILYKYIPVRYMEQSVTRDQVMELVNQTASDIETDAQGTFARIIAAEHPYMDKDNPELYVFVYDTDVTIVADHNPKLVGVNVSGKSDVSGKMFRDEIVAGALQRRTGWVDYIYANPVKSGLYYKTTYYKLITGNDGKQYVVCGGMYKTEA
jgi:polar amino acid transport system substrate-binding protein